MTIECIDVLDDDNIVINDVENLNLINQFKNFTVHIQNDESLSLYEIFSNISNDDNLKIQYTFDCNLFVFVNFNGKMSDFLNYLHKSNNIHTDFEILEDNILHVTFKECSILQSYVISCANVDELVSKIKSNIKDVDIPIVTDNCLFITTSCKNHQIIKFIIDKDNELNDMCVDLELVTLDIFLNDNFDSSCSSLLREIVSIYANNNINQLSQVIGEFSRVLNNNNYGNCKITSNTYCILWNNRFIEINTCVNNGKKIVYKDKNGKYHDTDNSISYVKLQVKANIVNNGVTRLNFKIQNKCNLGDNKECINDSDVFINVEDNKLFYLLDRNGVGDISESSWLFSSNKQHTMRTIVLGKVTKRKK